MIYLLDRHEQLLDIISETELTEFVCQVSLNAFDEASFELPPTLFLESFEKAHYFGFFHRDVFKIFRIVENNCSDSRYVKGIDRAESDLRTVTVIKDKRPHNVTADQALRVALEGTGYQVGDVQGLPKVASTSFYYISPLDALVKILERWQCEFRVRYIFVENRVTGRYIDLYKSQGKVSGKQFYYGDNLLSVVHEESPDHIVTALIGRGKGEELDSGGYGRRIEFTNVSWSKASGKPTDKPAGQNYVVNDKARQLYGLSQDGTLHHRWGVFIDENIEDPEELLVATYAELERLSAPLTVFKASILSLDDDVWLGDRVAIIRDELKIAFEARVQKLVIDLLHFEQSEVILGDYQTLKRQQERLEGQRLQQSIDERLSPYAADLQRFYERVEREKERHNTEIDERFRLAQLEFDNFKELAETNANAFKETISNQIDTDIRPLANEAKRVADGAVLGLARQRGELEAVRSSVGTAKADAIREAGRLVDVAKGTLSGQLSTAKSEAIREATNQLNRAKEELTGLVDGAKREARNLVDGLSVGGRNYLPYGKAFWEVGVISGDATTLVNHAHFRRTRGYIPVSEGEYTLNAKGSYGIGLFFYDADNRKVAYSGPHALLEIFWYVGSGFPLKIPIPAGAKKIKVAFRSNVDPFFTDDASFENALKGMKLEKGNVATDWSPAPEDYSHTLEELDNGYREKFKVIEGNDTERRAFQTEMEKKVDGFRLSISSLNQKFDSEGNLAELTRYKNERRDTDSSISQKLSELVAYKDGESGRSQAYFEASKVETARQLLEERKVITDTYVAKNQYEEDARGITRRFEAIKVGGRNYVLNSKNFRGGQMTLASDFVKDLNTARVLTLSLTVSGRNLSPRYDRKARFGFEVEVRDAGNNPWYYGVWYTGTEEVEHKRIQATHRLPDDFQVARVFYVGAHKQIEGDVEMSLPMVELSSVASAYRPAEEDFRSEFATYKQGVDGQLSTLTKNLGDKVSSTTFKQTADEVVAMASTLENDVMKSSDFTIDANGLVLQSGREFNGSTITNLLTVNPDNIKAITDKMIITPAQRNLVLLALRADEAIILNARDKFVTGWLTPEMFNEPLEFAVLGRALRTSIQSQALWLRAYFQHTDNTVYERYVRLADGSGTRSIDFEETLKIPKIPSKTIREFRFSLHQKVDSGFARWTVSDFRIYHKTSASLLVDGSIEARHIKAGSIETGHLKAGSVTATVLSAEAVTASKLKVDQALIDKLTVSDLLARRITASSLFATQVQAVEISASMVKSGLLASRNGATSFNLDTGELLFYTDSPAIKRIARGYPNQFVKFSTGILFEEGGNQRAGVTVIGSNRDGSENANNGTFAGIRIWNSSGIDKVDIVGDTVRLASSPYDNADGWVIRTTPNELSIDARRGQDRPTSVLNIGDVYLHVASNKYYSLNKLIDDIYENFRTLGSVGAFDGRDYWGSWR